MLHLPVQKGSPVPPKPKDLNTPELNKVKREKAKMDADKARLAASRKKYDDAVVEALEQHGLRTLARVAEVSTAAIRDIRDKPRKDA
jgi:division protein CdvB (Snf7/Vps24/ESCRT-III family)